MKFLATLIILFFIGYAINRAISKSKKDKNLSKNDFKNFNKKRVNLLSLENAKKRIQELGLPNFYIDVLNKKKIHQSLEYFCQFPNWLYSDKNFIEGFSDILADYDEVIPLCEEGDITALIAVLVKDNSIKFIHMIYESPNTYKTYNSRQALLVDLFVMLWEMSDEEKSSELIHLQEVASEINFKHIDELNELLWSNSDDYDKRVSAIKKFKENLDMKNSL